MAHSHLYCSARFLLLYLLWTGVAFAETQSIVVTPHRTISELSSFGGSLTVISSEDIKQSQYVNVSDLLRMYPGIDVVRSGGRGGNTSIFMRGTNSEHVLILLDGIELNNPVNPTRSFNFGDLSLENVERIEILRGPQSGVWGSNAIGGVINIITKTGEGTPQVAISSEGGTFERFIQRARVSYADERVQTSLGVVREREDGISAADERSGNLEEDNFENTSLTWRAKYTSTWGGVLDNTLRINRSQTGLDNQGGAFGDDPNRDLKNEQLFWRSALSGEFFDKKWTPTLGVSYTYHNLEDENFPDALHPLDELVSRYRGEVATVDFVNALQVSEALHLVAGFEFQKERGSSLYQSDGAFGPFEDRFGPFDATNRAYFLDALYEMNEYLSLSSAVRLDNHETFGETFTYNISPVVHLFQKATRLRGALGTGFRAPSLSQLFSPYGSTELEPEESLSWEVGADHTFYDGNATVGLTYYRQDVDQLITFDPATFIFQNINEVEIDGFEIYGEFEPVVNLKFRVDYTALSSRDTSTDEQLLRRAKDRFNLALQYSLSRIPATVGVSYRYVGARFDNNFESYPPARERLSPYGIVDLRMTFQAAKGVRLYGRIENLLDEQYQDVLGFGTYGRGLFAGLEVTL